MSSGIRSLVLEEPAKPRLRRAMPWDLDPEEAKQFLRAVEFDDHGGGAESLIHQIGNGDLALWVWGGDESVVIVVSCVKYHEDGFKEFFVRVVAGESLFSRYDEFAADFTMAAKEFGCDRVVSLMKPEIYEAWVKGCEARDRDFNARVIYHVIEHVMTEGDRDGQG